MADKLDVNKSNEWSFGEFKEYFTTSNRLFGNSPEFKAIAQRVKDVFLYEEQNISPEMIEARTAVMNELIAATNDYITKRANPITSTGKDRLKIAKDLLAFCKEDIEYTTFAPTIEYFNGKKMADARKGVSYDEIHKLDSSRNEDTKQYDMSEDAIKGYAAKVKKLSLATKICMKFNKLLSRRDKEELTILDADYEAELEAVQDPDVVKGMRYMYVQELETLKNEGILNLIPEAKEVEAKAVEAKEPDVGKIREAERRLSEARKRAWNFENPDQVKKARELDKSKVTISDDQFKLMEGMPKIVAKYEKTLQDDEEKKKIDSAKERKEAELKQIEEQEKVYAAYENVLEDTQKLYDAAQKKLKEKEEAYNQIMKSGESETEKQKAEAEYKKSQEDFKEMGFQITKASEDLKKRGMDTGHDKRVEEIEREEKVKWSKLLGQSSPEKKEPEMGTAEFEKYFSNSHRLGGSSETFKMLREQVAELDELDSMPVTKELAEGRRLLLEMIQETSAKYVREHTGAKSPQGKERLEMVQALGRFCESEIPLMKSEKKVQYFEGKSFSDITKGIDGNELRALSVEMRKIQLQPMNEDRVIKYTNTLAKYIPMAEAFLDDESTKLIPEKQEMLRQVNEYKSAIGQMRDFRNVKKLVAEGKSWADLNALREPRVVWDQPIEKQGGQISERIKLNYNGKMGFFTKEVKFKDKKTTLRSEILKQSSTKDILFFLEHEKIMLDMLMSAGDGYSGRRTLTNRIDRSAMSKTKGNDYEMLAELESNEDLFEKCVNILDTTSNAFKAASFVTNTDEVEMSRRNTASTRVAELLGIGESLAHTESMKVIIGGVEYNGCFMEFAEGIDPTTRKGPDFEKLTEAQFRRNASYNRSESNLEILDVLCGQKDRHGKNFFYQLSEIQPDGTRNVVGIQGIDNDIAFSSESKLFLGRNVTSEGLTFIDKELAATIRGLTPDKIDYALSDVLLPSELNAFKDRLDAFKEHLATNMVEIDKDGWELNEFDETKVYDHSTLDTRAQNYLHGLKVFREHDKETRARDIIHRASYLQVELNAAKTAKKEQEAKSERTAKADDIISQIAAKKEGSQPTAKTAEQKEPTKTSFAEISGIRNSLRNPGTTMGSAAKTAEKKVEADKQAEQKKPTEPQKAGRKSGKFS